MTDIVLVHPNGVHGIYGALGDQLVSREQPLWPRLIAGYLLDRQFDVAIIDAECDGLTPEQVTLQIAEYNPRVVAIVVSGHQPSASTQAMPGARAVAEALQNYYCDKGSLRPRIVMMGNHPSALPVRTLTEESPFGVDYVIDGEGPITLLGLLNDEDRRTIPGLVYWDQTDFGNGNVGELPHSNPLAPLLDVNVDLHGNAWHLLPPPSRYRSHSWQRLGSLEDRNPYAAIFTSLGCAFKCHFCMINVFQHTNRYRMRNPEMVVEEIAMLYHKYGVKTFKMTDELFVLNKNHCRDICEGIIKAGLGNKISIWCYARPDTVGSNELAMFRQAGFDWFALGIESGAESIRDGADKSMSQQEIKDVVRDIEAAGINVIANYIFGLPGETHETMQATLDLAQGLNTAFANFYCAMAYPGSKLYDEAVEKGWPLPETWAGYSQHNEFSTPLRTDALSAAELLAFRDQAFTTYFTSKRYVDNVTQRFGQEARVHIEKMTSYKLKRRLLDNEGNK